MSFILHAVVWLQTSVFVLSHRMRRNDRGQATAEYALVLLGAAAVAVLVVGWAAKTGRVGALLDSVFDSVTGKIK
ncbi:MAG: DUF4244 domain-containing protein [Actinobacteria bacterium]|nr:DUF4244 domain-containing protein [Actinomycetota bacterium]